MKRNISTKKKQKIILEFIEGFDPSVDVMNLEIMSPEIQAHIYAAQRTLPRLLRLQFDSRFWWQFFNVLWSLVIVAVLILIHIYSDHTWTSWMNLGSLGLLFWNFNSNYNYYLTKKVFIDFLYDRLSDGEPDLFKYLSISKAAMRHRNH